MTEYPHYEAGFFFSPVKMGTFPRQYACYVVHETLRYQSGLGYPSPSLVRFSRLGESYVVVYARNRRVAEKKVRKTLRKYHRKNIL